MYSKYFPKYKIVEKETHLISDGKIVKDASKFFIYKRFCFFFYSGGNKYLGYLDFSNDYKIEKYHTFDKAKEDLIGYINRKNLEKLNKKKGNTIPFNEDCYILPSDSINKISEDHELKLLKERFFVKDSKNFSYRNVLKIPGPIPEPPPAPGKG